MFAFLVVMKDTIIVYLHNVQMLKIVTHVPGQRVTHVPSLYTFFASRRNWFRHPLAQRIAKKYYLHFLRARLPCACPWRATVALAGGRADKEQK